MAGGSIICIDKTNQTAYNRKWTRLARKVTVRVACRPQGMDRANLTLCLNQGLFKSSSRNSIILFLILGNSVLAKFPGVKSVMVSGRGIGG